MGPFSLLILVGPFISSHMRPSKLRKTHNLSISVQKVQVCRTFLWFKKIQLNLISFDLTYAIQLIFSCQILQTWISRKSHIRKRLNPCCGIIERLYEFEIQWFENSHRSLLAYSVQIYNQWNIWPTYLYSMYHCSSYTQELFLVNQPVKETPMKEKTIYILVWPTFISENHNKDIL